GTARWGAYRFALALGQLGFGSVHPVVVNRQPTAGGQTRSAAKIRENLVLLSALPTLEGRRVLLVDDTVTRGSSLVVVNQLLGSPACFAFVGGVTSDTPRDSALTPIRRVLTYNGDNIEPVGDEELEPLGK